MGKIKQELNQRRHEFLLTFFEEQSGHSIKDINGFVLEKRWNGSLNRWEVAIYTPESWKKVEEWNNEQKLFKNNRA